jgi:hypothetical protein
MRHQDERARPKAGRRALDGSSEQSRNSLFDHPHRLNHPHRRLASSAGVSAAPSHLGFLDIRRKACAVSPMTSNLCAAWLRRQTPQKIFPDSPVSGNKPNNAHGVLSEA